MCDGGVYDNLGLATVYKRQLTVPASDAGGLNDPEAEPATNWLLQFVHVSLMMNNEVQALRKHQLISAYENKWRQGAYWGINSDVRHYKLRGHLHIPASYAKLGQVSVRLKTLDDKIQEKLINWGYAISDVAIRKHYLKKSKVKHCYPYAGRGR
jgi:NTE family protein